MLCRVYFAFSDVLLTSSMKLLFACSVSSFLEYFPFEVVIFCVFGWVIQIKQKINTKLSSLIFLCFVWAPLFEVTAFTPHALHMLQALYCTIYVPLMHAYLHPCLMKIILWCVPLSLSGSSVLYQIIYLFLQDFIYCVCMACTHRYFIVAYHADNLALWYKKLQKVDIQASCYIQSESPWTPSSYHCFHVLLLSYLLAMNLRSRCECVYTHNSALFTRRNLHEYDIVTSSLQRLFLFLPARLWLKVNVHILLWIMQSLNRCTGEFRQAWLAFAIKPTGSDPTISSFLICPNQLEH